MIRNIINKIVPLAVAISVVSCDDFLTQEDPSNPAADTFYESLTQVDQTLTSVYTAMRDESIFQQQYEAFRSDMAYPGYGRPVPASQGTRYNCYTLNYNYTTDWLDDKWDACYTTIYRANQTIKALEELALNSEEAYEYSDEWIEIMAQARFFRGLMHFYLHSAFNEGSVLLVDSVPEDLEDFYRPLATSEEVKEFFRADLQFAYENLPIVYSDATEDLGRVTSGAAATVLGTSYLYEYNECNETEYLDAAMSLFNYVMNDCGYELIQDGEQLFNEEYEMNSESIFEIVYDNHTQTEMGDWDAYNFTQMLGYYSTSYSSGHYLPAWLANAYQNEPIDPNNPRNLYEQVIDTETGESEMQVRRMPLRASAMVALYEDMYTPWYLATCVPAKNKSFGYSGYGFGFYKKHSTCKTQDTDEQQLGMNIVVNRLAEVYLMYAECLIYKGDITEALRIMNILRERWGLVLLGSDQGDGFTYDGYTYDAATLLKQLQQVDKPLECSLEGHMTRWLDLRRWGILGSNIKSLGQAVYYAVPHTETTDLNGITYKNDNCPVVYTAAQLAADPQSTYYTIDFEYDVAASVFNYDTYAWFPIPLGEVEQNPNLYK
ncbi:MAG: RagB/SusD family nutrient uptake outer membrane protein [Rikenellaceae bacterium]